MPPVSSGADERQQRSLEAVRAETSLPGLLHVATREFVEVVDGLACAISRVVGDVLIQVAEYARDDRTLVLGHGYLISDFPLTEVSLRDGEPRIVSVLEEQADPREATLLQELELDSLLMLPLMATDGAWGLVEVYINGRMFGDADLARAQPVATAFVERLAALPAPASTR